MDINKITPAEPFNWEELAERGEFLRPDILIMGRPPQDVRGVTVSLNGVDIEEIEGHTVHYSQVLVGDNGHAVGYILKEVEGSGAMMMDSKVCGVWHGAIEVEIKWADETATE